MSPWRRISALIVAVALVLLFSAFYPFRQLRTSQSELERVKHQLVEREKERDDLETRSHLLRRPEEIERLARERFGLTRPGEVPFVVVPDKR